MNKIKMNKKAQVGETMTWVIATIIIIVILIIFIYVSSVLPKTSGVRSSDLKSDSKIVDWINLKTSFAYFFNSENKQIIDKWIREEKE